MTKPVGLAVLGAGTWGRNLLRAFASLPGCSLVAVAEPARAARERLAEAYTGLRLLAEPEEALRDPAVEAVAIATPSETHARMASMALSAGRHVFVEKPMALSLAEARRLAALARARSRTLMVGHLMEYHPGFRKVCELARSGALGRILYVYSQRVNLGVIRKHENALWSLAPHDVSMVLALFGRLPARASARGGAYVQRGRHDVVFADLFFPSGSVAHIHVSWLDPHKRRCLTVVGDRRMAVFDDMEPVEKVRVYEKRAALGGDYASYGEFIAVHSGEVRIPRLLAAEPLRLECDHFLRCVRNGTEPRTGAKSGLDVVRVLEAADRALATGRTVEV